MTSFTDVCFRLSSFDRLLNELSRRAKDKSQVVSSEAQHVWIPTWLLQL